MRHGIAESSQPNHGDGDGDAHAAAGAVSIAFRNTADSDSLPRPSQEPDRGRRGGGGNAHRGAVGSPRRHAAGPADLSARPAPLSSDRIRRQMQRRQ